MQVKKFEAKTMQEALLMVKQELGPEAIILSAKNNKKGFGLVDSVSVEVTAAVSPNVLRKRQFAEKKLKEEEIEKFRRSPAIAQKQFIEKVIDQQKARKPRPITARPYVDIGDEGGEKEKEKDTAESRIKSAAQRAFDALSEGPVAKPASQNRSQAGYRQVAQRRVGQPMVQTQVSQPVVASAQGAQTVAPSSIANLEREIKQLKTMLADIGGLKEIARPQFPGCEFGLRYELSSIYQKMIRSGVSENFIVNLLRDAQDMLGTAELKKPAYVEAWLVKKMMDEIRTVVDPYGSWIHCFVGAPGAGKTSALIKYATDLVVKRKKKIAILTCDSQKVGAVEQMRIFAKILNVPFGTLDPYADWSDLKDRLRQFDHVLIDYPGTKIKEEEDIEALRALLPPSEFRTIHYVASLAARDDANEEIARDYYEALHFDDVILTNLDGATHYGFLYNVTKQFARPLHSFGIGSAIPEDFEYATRERVIDLIFEISKKFPTERIVDGGLND